MSAQVTDPIDRLIRVLTDPASSPWLHAILVFLTSSVGGLATHLRDGGLLTTKQIASAVLNAGLFGLIVFLVMFKRMQDDYMLLVGISLLSGMGCTSLFAFALELLKRFWVAFITGASPNVCMPPPRADNPPSDRSEP